MLWMILIVGGLLIIDQGDAPRAPKRAITSAWKIKSPRPTSAAHQNIRLCFCARKLKDSYSETGRHYRYVTNQ